MAKVTVGQENSERHRDLLRGPRQRKAGGADPRLPAERALLGEAAPGVLLDAGYRVITYDRRGFGASSQPTIGYDYDTFAADLNALLDAAGPARHGPGRVLDGHRRGHPLPGHATARAGSARRCCSGAIPPFLLKTADNPEGVDQSVFDGLMAAWSRPTGTPTSRTSWTTSTTSTCSARGPDQRPGLAELLHHGGRGVRVRGIRLAGAPAGAPRPPHLAPHDLTLPHRRRHAPRGPAGVAAGRPGHGFTLAR